MTQIRLCALAFGVSAFVNVAAADDRPLALVEHVDAPAAGIAAFDYVYVDDKIDLRPDGELHLAYFDRCEVEVFTGGVIKLKEDDIKISKGGVSSKQARACQTASLALSDDAKEAGAAVKRVSPFAAEGWREISIAVATPRFIWPKPEKTDVSSFVRIFLLEADPAVQVWQGAADENHLTYPAEAPALEVGLPYRVDVSHNGKTIHSAVFSIDPNLELPESILTTAVPLGL